MTSTGSLGKEYQGGETVIRQGEMGDCMFVIQSGKVEIVAHSGDKEIRLAVRGEGEFIGEMGLFEREVRSADVRALGPARILKIDKRNLMARIHEDPSLAFRLIQVLCHRVRELSDQVTLLKSEAD